MSIESARTAKLRSTFTRCRETRIDALNDHASLELSDSRHHLMVALDGGLVVGFVSAVHYVHPDKPAELWINEVGVAPSHQRQGLGKRLLQALFARGRELGCREAWVLTSPANGPAVRLYESVGGVDLADPPVMFTFRLADIRE